MMVLAQTGIVRHLLVVLRLVLRRSLPPSPPHIVPDEIEEPESEEEEDRGPVVRQITDGREA
jgi:hypothetical protein